MFEPEIEVKPMGQVVSFDASASRADGIAHFKPINSALYPPDEEFNAREARQSRDLAKRRSEPIASIDLALRHQPASQRRFLNESSLCL